MTHTQTSTPGRETTSMCQSDALPGIDSCGATGTSLLRLSHTPRIRATSTLDPGVLPCNVNTMKRTGLRATYSGHPYSWHGVVKDGSRVVETCPHTHHNRDQWSPAWGPSARDCATKMLREMQQGDAP